MSKLNTFYDIKGLKCNAIIWGVTEMMVLQKMVQSWLCLQRNMGKIIYILMSSNVSLSKSLMNFRFIFQFKDYMFV